MEDRVFSLVVVTPVPQVFEGQVRSLQAPGTDGDFEVLVGHIPMLTSLRPGVVTLRNTDGRSIYAISGGFVEVMRHEATVLAETIERVDSIDVERARDAEKRAQDRIESAASTSVDMSRAQSALARAQNRLRASQLANK